MHIRLTVFLAQPLVTEGAQSKPRAQSGAQSRVESKGGVKK